MKEFEFLRHVLTPKGVKPQQRLLGKIQDFLRRINGKGIRRFLGLIQYYAAFIPNMSEMTKHLHKFTVKGARFTWDENAECNIQRLKKLLISPPMLFHIDYLLPLILLTDANDHTIRASLCYKIDNKYRPIVYTAKMIGAQKKYSILQEKGCKIC